MKNPYNPEFIAKMKQGEEDIKAGRTTKIEPADVWNLTSESEQAIYNRLKKSAEEIKLYKEGKIKLQDATEFLKSL